MLSQESESTSILLLLDHLDDSFQENNARLDSFQVTSGKLEEALEPIDEDKAGPTLNRSHIERIMVFERGMLRRR